MVHGDSALVKDAEALLRAVAAYEPDVAWWALATEAVSRSHASAALTRLSLGAQHVYTALTASRAFGLGP